VSEPRHRDAGLAHACGEATSPPAQGGNAPREGDERETMSDPMPMEAVERVARVWARALLDLYPEADTIAIFRPDDVRPGRELAVATRGQVHRGAVVDDMQPGSQRHVA
jgi:hypothetical protein